MEEPRLSYVRVQDLNRTRTFYEALGFAFEPKYSDEQSLAMKFPVRDLPDTNGYIKFVTDQGLMQGEYNFGKSGSLDLKLDSREALDALADKAVSLGAKENSLPVESNPHFHQRVVEDLDGYLLDLRWIDPKEDY